jgi:hypothetical protein
MRIISADWAPTRQGLVQVAGLIDRVIKQVDYRSNPAWVAAALKAAVDLFRDTFHIKLGCQIIVLWFIYIIRGQADIRTDWRT